MYSSSFRGCIIDTEVSVLIGWKNQLGGQMNGFSGKCTCFATFFFFSGYIGNSFSSCGPICKGLSPRIWNTRRQRRMTNWPLENSAGGIFLMQCPCIHKATTLYIFRASKRDEARGNWVRFDVIRVYLIPRARLFYRRQKSLFYLWLIHLINCQWVK